MDIIPCLPVLAINQNHKLKINSFQSSRIMTLCCFHICFTATTNIFLKMNLERFCEAKLVNIGCSCCKDLTAAFLRFCLISQIFVATFDMM